MHIIYYVNKREVDKEIFLYKSAQKLMHVTLHIQLSSNSVFCQHLKEDVLLIVQPF